MWEMIFIKFWNMKVGSKEPLGASGARVICFLFVQRKSYCTSLTEQETVYVACRKVANAKARRPLCQAV